MLGVSVSLILIGAINGALLRFLFKETTPGNEGIFLVLGVFAFTIPMVPVLLLLQSISSENFGAHLPTLVSVYLISFVFLSKKLDISVTDF